MIASNLIILIIVVILLIYIIKKSKSSTKNIIDMDKNKSTECFSYCKGS